MLYPTRHLNENCTRKSLTENWSEKVVAVRPLKLTAHHHVPRRRDQEVSAGMLTVLAGVGRLDVAVADVDARGADRARQAMVPA